MIGTPKDQTSEELHDVVKQPKDTCPTIDGVVGNIERCQALMRGYDSIDNPETLQNILLQIELELGEVVGFRGEGLLEDIRDNAKAIRSWGEDWKVTALKYYERLSEEERAE